MPDPTIQGIDASSVARFIGRNADRYVQKWREIELKGSVVNWHWPAFLFGPFWLAYRKMYLYAALLLVLAFCVDLIAKIETPVGLTAAIAQMVLMGLFGNAIYRKHVVGEVSVIQGLHTDDMDRAVAMARRGGRSVGAVFGFLLLALVLGAITTVLQDDYFRGGIGPAINAYHDDQATLVAIQRGGGA